MLIWMLLKGGCLVLGYLWIGSFTPTVKVLPSFTWVLPCVSHHIMGSLTARPKEGGLLRGGGDLQGDCGPVHRVITNYS